MHLKKIGTSYVIISFFFFNCSPWCTSLFLILTWEYYVLGLLCLKYYLFLLFIMSFTSICSLIDKIVLLLSLRARIYLSMPHCMSWSWILLSWCVSTLLLCLLSFSGLILMINIIKITLGEILLCYRDHYKNFTWKSLQWDNMYFCLWRDIYGKCSLLQITQPLWISRFRMLKYDGAHKTSPTCQDLTQTGNEQAYTWLLY